jgi:hypothetical protein
MALSKDFLFGRQSIAMPSMMTHIGRPYKVIRPTCFLAHLSMKLNDVLRLITCDSQLYSQTLHAGNRRLTELGL